MGRALEHLTLARKHPSQEARRRGFAAGYLLLMFRGGGRRGRTNRGEEGRGFLSWGTQRARFVTKNAGET